MIVEVNIKAFQFEQLILINNSWPNSNGYFESSESKCFAQMKPCRRKHGKTEVLYWNRRSIIISQNVFTFEFPVAVKIKGISTGNEY